MRARHFCLILCLGAITAACGAAPSPGKTPKETAKSYEAALREADFAGAYALLTEGARKRVAIYCRALPGCAGQDAAEVLDDSSGRARENGSGKLDKLQIVIGKVKDYGERATVEATLLIPGRSADIKLPMVREKGHWLLDDPGLLLGMHVQYAPPEVACASPSG